MWFRCPILSSWCTRSEIDELNDQIENWIFYCRMNLRNYSIMQDYFCFIVEKKQIEGDLQIWTERGGWRSSKCPFCRVLWAHFSSQSASSVCLSRPVDRFRLDSSVSVWLEEFRQGNSKSSGFFENRRMNQCDFVWNKNRPCLDYLRNVYLWTVDVPDKWYR